MNPEFFYRHSGRVPVGGLLLTLFGGSLAGAALAYGYAYGIHYIPLIYVNVLLTVLFGCLIGGAAAVLAQAGSVRSAPVAGLAGLAAGGAGFYVHWAVWLSLVGAPPALELLGEPQALWYGVKLVNAAGPWTVFDWTPTGGALWAFWAIEALLVVGIAAGMAGALIHNLAFCERCAVWAQTEKTVGPLEPFADATALRAQAERGELGALRSLARRNEPGDRYAELEIMTCPSCQQFRLVTVKEVAREVDAKGEEKKQEATLLRNLILDSETYTALAQL